MTRTTFRLAGVALLSLVSSAMSVAQDRPSFPLPADPSTPVVIMEERGFVVYGNRKNFEPVLTIRADGSVKVVDPMGDPSGVQGKISPSELQDLLRFVIDEQNFFTLSPKGDFNPVPPELENLHILLDHAQTTWIRIQIANKQHESMLDYSRMREPVDQIKAVEKRLRAILEGIKAQQSSK